MGRHEAMKTSFAEFEQRVPYRQTQKVYIDCEKVVAVELYRDSNGKKDSAGDTTVLHVCPDMMFFVVGKPEEILKTVKSYCKERNP